MEEEKKNSDTRKALMTDSQRFLCFSLAEEQFAIPLLSVKEVIAMPEVTPIPNAPPYFLGIMNLRGHVISIIDLRAKFGIKSEKSSDNCVVICDLGAMPLGVVVSGVNNVLAAAPTDIGEKPDLQGSKAGEYVSGVVKRDKKLVLLIDIEKALGVEDKAALNRARETKKAA